MMAASRPILLVEDNPDDERFTLRALRRSQVTSPILVAHNGEEALSVLASMRPLPSVVLLDLKLPKIDGLEVLRRIRSDRRIQHLPVVVLTSSNEERDVVASYNLGVNSYVCKPIEIEQFTATIGQLGLYWVRVNQSLPGDD